MWIWSKSVALGAQSIISGDADIVVVGGMENIEPSLSLDSKSTTRRQNG